MQKAQLDAFRADAAAKRETAAPSGHAPDTRLAGEQNTAPHTTTSVDGDGTSACSKSPLRDRVRCQPAFVFTSPGENPRASGHGAMTFVPFGIPHGVLSGLLLPLRMLGAVKRDVFLDYPHVAVVVAPAAQLQLFRSGNEFQNV